jgi:group II intron reverse transcriptase/maturase
VIADRAQDTPIDKVRVLQQKLYRSAKAHPKRTYGILADKVWRDDVLYRAWDLVKANRGAPGVDGVTMATIEREGVADFLRDLQQALQAGTYRPQPVRRVYIPKANGKRRPLGIPCIRDRVAQAAVKLVIEPLFEADFQDHSYGFRPKRSAHDALAAIRKWVHFGYAQIVDLDLTCYFDTVPHAKLMRVLRRRIRDRRVLGWIWQWLKAGVLDGTTLEPNRVGTPQGGVLSPLLANVYLNVLDTYWVRRGRERRAHLVRFADDMVVCCERDAEGELAHLQQVLGRMDLRINPEKTRVVSAREGFDFLGHRIRYERSRTGKRVCYQWPNPRAQQRLRDRWREILRTHWNARADTVIPLLNPVTRGWGAYFRRSNAGPTFHALDHVLYTMLTRWHHRQHRKKVRYREYSRAFWEHLGVVFPTGLLRSGRSGR